MFTQTKLTILNDFFLLTLHTWRMYVIYSDHLLVDRSKDHRLCSKPAHYDSFQQREINCLEGLPWWLSGKESTCQCKRHGFNPWVTKIPRKRKRQPTLVFLPGKSHRKRSLAGYSPWGHKRVGHNSTTKQQATTNCLEEIKLFVLYIAMWARGNSDRERYTSSKENFSEGCISDKIQLYERL